MKQMSLSARQELIASVRPRYRAATRKDKQPILDEFIAATGYHRKYAIALLGQSSPDSARLRSRHSKRPATYGADVRDALVAVWHASNHLCSKRLVPFLPEFVSVLERQRHLSLSERTRTQLLTISPATADRLLSQARRTRKGAALSTTRPGTLLKHQIPIRTFADWDDARPGFVEADLVAHCGISPHGAYLNTLTLTDVLTGWTECFALVFDDHRLVIEAIDTARRFLPFPLLGLDTDNGSEFLNYGLLDYCRREQLTFTRCRPYKKNDQCHVEQKNGSIVRRIVGYDRYEGQAACTQLATLYGVVRLYVNYFQPSLKLASKQRQGAKVIKKYDAARTPYQRVMASSLVSEDAKQTLTREYERLDPVALHKQIELPRDSLWRHAFRPPEWIAPTESAEASVALGPGTSRSHKQALTPQAAAANQRTYRRTKKPTRHHLVKHTWRTRPDPFVLVTDRIEELLIQDPAIGVKTLLQRLQRENPGLYDNTLLRTLQRRVKGWRQQHTAWCPVLVEPEAASVAVSIE